MRRIILVLVLLGTSCAPAPKPAVKSAAELPPLGPCPASSWKPEAPPPTASHKTSMVLLAVGEWARYGRQVITYSADARPRTEQLGVKEREAPQRIQDYWASVGHPERSGLDDVPWSAAFISWDIQSAGVPRDLFCPDQRHTAPRGQRWRCAPGPKEPGRSKTTHQAQGAVINAKDSPVIAKADIVDTHSFFVLNVNDLLIQHLSR